jgi:hypothetical protein
MTPDPSRSKKRNTAERRGGVGERMRKIMRWGGGECVGRERIMRQRRQK